MFDTEFYLKNNPHAQKSKLNPLLHFLRFGKMKRLTPHPLFDTHFYLSKYPDIKKLSINPLVHFVWRGARERRWPNADFDTMYYLKIISPTAFDNPLLHYLEIGKKQHLPTQPKYYPSWNWKILERLICFLIFPVFCLEHSFKRRRIDKAINFDHQFSAFKFWRISVMRFWQGHGRSIKLTTPAYLTQPKRLESPESHMSRLSKSPKLFCYLYLANIFKVQGFFADAENILSELNKHIEIRDLSLSSLGDLLLVQAIWANEFKSYEIGGIALNPFAASKIFADSYTWHKRTFTQAIDILKEALLRNEQNIDAQWLLCYAYLAAGKYTLAIESLNKYPGREAEAAERNAFKARAMFALDPNQGVALRREYLGEWSHNCNIAALQQISAASVPVNLVLDNLLVVKAINLPIMSTVVRNREAISFKNELKFADCYLSRFESVQIIPEFGAAIVGEKMLIKESVHMKPCHIPIYNSYIQEVVGESAFICAPKPMLFNEEGCIYIGHNDNFYHWLIDELPRLSVVERTGLFDKAPILIDQNASYWQREALSLLDIDQSRLRPVNFKRPLLFKNLIIPSCLSRDMVAHPEAVSFMRKKLVLDQAYKPTADKRIYITRSSNTTSGRSMLNESKIVDKFKRANFKIVDTSQLSIQEQIEMFHDVDVIAGPGGAGLANILFGPKGARVLILGSSHILCETFTSIAAAIGQQSWAVRGISYARPYPNWVWTNFDYEIDEKDIDFCFEHIL